MYDHMFDAEERGDPYYPWRDFVEWEMVRFLSRCGLSRAMVDEFLQLRYVTERPFSFKSARQMYDMVKDMPGGPEWRAHDVILHDAPQEPQRLYYRNIIDCAAFLLQSTEFNGHMEFAPQRACNENGILICN